MRPVRAKSHGSARTPHATSAAEHPRRQCPSRSLPRVDHPRFMRKRSNLLATNGAHTCVTRTARTLGGRPADRWATGAGRRPSGHGSTLTITVLGSPSPCGKLWTTTRTKTYPSICAAGGATEEGTSHADGLFCPPGPHRHRQASRTLTAVEGTSHSTWSRTPGWLERSSDTRPSWHLLAGRVS